MVELLDTYSPNHRATPAEYRLAVYLSNGWDRMLRWDGRTPTTELAGISPPPRTLDTWLPAPVEAAGGSGVGIHLVRYRYLDSRTGYVSNPSEIREARVTAGNGKLTFLIGDATAGSVIGNLAFGATTITRGAGDWTTVFAIGDYVTIASAENAANNGLWGPVTNVSALVLTIGSAAFTVNADDDSASISRASEGRIRLSDDPKVDRIVLEGTIVGGTEEEFFKVTEVVNAEGTVIFDIPDDELEQAFLPWDDEGHDPPPVAKIVLSHADRIWLYAQVIHQVGTADFTNASVDVAEGATDPDWRESALGDSTAAVPTRPSVEWLIRKNGDDDVYEVDYYDESANKLVLKTAYQGTTEADAGYTLFSRANEIWVSRAGYPESFEPLNSLKGPAGEGAGPVVAAVGYGQNMIFFTDRSQFRISWEEDPLVDGQLIPITNVHGALSQRVVLSVEGVIYAMDRTGWTRWDGTFPERISRPVDDVRELIDYDQFESFHAVYLPEIRAIRWFFVLLGDTVPRYFVQLDVDNLQWGTGEYLQGVTESRLVPTAAGPSPYLGDDQGHLWESERGTSDGAGDAHHLVDAGGSTSDTLYVTDQLPVDGVGLAGAYLQWRKSDGTVAEQSLIVSNTELSLTLETPLSAAPTAGEIYWVGMIPARLRTRAYSARGSKRRKVRTSYATLEFTPEPEARRVQLRAYDNLQFLPRAWAPRSADREDLSGVAFPGTNVRYPFTDWLCDLSHADGQWSVPLGSEFRRYCEVEVECQEPNAVVELSSLEVAYDPVKDLHD